MLGGCERPDPEVAKITAAPTLIQLSLSPAATTTETRQPTLTPTATPRPLVTPSASYFGTPTPNPARVESPTGSGSYSLHVVTEGETLGTVAEFYETTISDIVTINDISASDFLSVGQELLVPNRADAVSPAFKLIPDSELVYGPAAKGFDVEEAAVFFGGYLESYGEEHEGRFMTGPEIVQLVADRFSMNPRLLMAMLEYQSGWVTRLDAEDDGYPMGNERAEYQGLYKQLSWAANLANFGFYGRSEGGIQSFEVGGELTVDFAQEINDGTAGLQLLFGNKPLTTFDGWLHDVGPDGFYATYNQLFGNPFVYTVDPIMPPLLTQPTLTLPWESGRIWFYTSGPHGGWASGSAWAALDFAPQHEQLGCYQSDEWTTSMSDGVIVRSDNGAVVVDLDGDGFSGTGWAITYMHLESRERVPAGLVIKEGDRLGHPSCEGGFSNGTHMHVARTYNGRWVSADGELPFVMDGWISQGLGREYDGLLIRDEVVKEACSCREEGNAITAD
jgi:LasA protease